MPCNAQSHIRSNTHQDKHTSGATHTRTLSGLCPLSSLRGSQTAGGCTGSTPCSAKTHMHTRIQAPGRKHTSRRAGPSASAYTNYEGTVLILLGSGVWHHPVRLRQTELLSFTHERGEGGEDGDVREAQALRELKADLEKSPMRVLWPYLCHVYPSSGRSLRSSPCRLRWTPKALQASHRTTPPSAAPIDLLIPCPIQPLPLAEDSRCTAVHEPRTSHTHT